MAEQDDKPLSAQDPETSEFPAQEWHTQSEAEWVDEINVHWRTVIENLMQGDRIYEAYGKAYEIEMKTERGYNTAKANGSRLLTNANFRRLWDKVIAEHGFNDQAADWRLMELMTNPDPAISVKAVKHYNELRGRIIKNVDVKSGGKEIQSPAIISAIEPRNDSPAQAEATAGN